MGYTFKNICIKNFKFITNEKPLEFKFGNRNIVILDGQNGYGKTTLFDAIEILLTGRIKHFNQTLQNRGLESLGTLANNDRLDIVISAVISSDSNKELNIERRLLCEKNFDSLLLLDGQEIQQEELYNRLKISLNMFDLGTYISQSDSLDFLKNKYKDRKNYVSSLSENYEINNKIKTLKEIQDFLAEKVSLESAEKDKVIKEKEKTVENIENQVNAIIKSDLPGENIRLFDEKEYSFDVIKMEEDTTYEAVVSPLKQITEFVENYEEYVNYIHNTTVRELLDTTKNTYMALFYKKEIELLNTKEELLQHLKKCKDLIIDIENNKWTIDKAFFEKIKIDNSIIKHLEGLLLNQQTERSQLADADKVLSQMTKTRRTFVSQFNDVANVGLIAKNKCPLCGTDLEELEYAIKETEEFIKNIHTDGVKRMEDIEKEIMSIFEEKITPKLRQLLEENRTLLQINDSLSGCMALSTNKLQKLMDEAGISKFESHKKEEFDINEFLKEYEAILIVIKNKEIPNKIDLSKEKIELFKSIHSTYYHNKKPKHSVEELRSKEQFIAKLFNDKLSLQLSIEKEKVNNLKKDYEKYVAKSDNMKEILKVLVSKYDAANKDYQTQLAEAIRIPLLVYSGRIIQNYPLGLGIKAVVNTNQLVFEAASKNGNDAYNILSTGQLNGLSIAFLLAIKNVYGTTDGLDILLIDDPLQTIDDISAISLADLLTQQSIGQIVLSTHEDAKASLLKYKFKRAGLSVREQNMQKTYMSAVMLDNN